MLKKTLLFFTLILSLSLITACDDDEGTVDTMPQYNVQIMQPSTDDKKVNDDIHVHVEFAEANRETIHHVNVKIYNKTDESIVLLDAPVGAHVHDESGNYAVHADVALTEAVGVVGHTDWILESKVWGHEAGVGEVVEQIEFHVHPE